MKFITPISIALLVLLDQITKIWTVNHFQNTGAENIVLWPGVLELTYVENRGAAFGMMQGKVWLFVLITAAVLGVILWYWRSIPENKSGVWMKIALVLVVSGAIGNLIDRVFIHYVRDMIYFSLIDFPVFNVADMCVVGGVILLFPILLFGELELEDTKKVNNED
ncbi:signal peptidase II [Niameybacter massiliensis]|uniref:Lipoprotein signal peptidase n=1 Tax=Holtiella tumoricola TaxID=3018743 RepID=A0AA42DPQ5_9FIRM|nr:MULTISPECIES: signal peptidase II [Lachnospirales]MDA3732566.1 signal peptidase II [Holtiella tumoricola]